MRRNQAPRRRVVPDARYNNEHIAMCVVRLMKSGKKSIARGIVYDALDTIAETTKKNPLEVFEQAIKNTSPMIEVKPRRVGGATYQIPVEVSPERRVVLSLRWLVTAARNRSGKSMAAKLAGELMDAANNVGTAVKRREDTHRMAEANRAYASYHW